MAETSTAVGGAIMNSSSNVTLRLLRYALSVEPLRWSLIVITLFGLLGCTATYTGGSVNSPDGKYVLYGHVRGAYGRSFIDQTAKTIRMDIVAKSGGDGKTLLQRKYRVQGSDVCWDAIWDKDDNLTLVFYDYGTGVSFYDARKNGTPKRQIRTVTYTFDSNTRAFSERPAK